MSDNPEALMAFPLESIRTVVAYARGDSSVTWQQAARAALDVIRFGLDQLGGEPQALTADALAQPLTEDEAIDRLEVLAGDAPAAPGGQPQPQFGGGAWAALLPVIAQLLAQWLAKRGAAGGA